MNSTGGPCLASPHAERFWEACRRGSMLFPGSASAWPVLGMAIVSTQVANSVVSLTGLTDPEALPAPFSTGSIPSQFPWVYVILHDASTGPDTSAKALALAEATFGKGACFAITINRGHSDASSNAAGDGHDGSSAAGIGPSDTDDRWKLFMQAPLIVSPSFVR